MFKRLIQLGLVSGALVALVGCGHYAPAPLAAAPGSQGSPVELSMNAETGSLVLHFRSAQALQSTSADLCFLSVTVSGSGLNYPVNQTISWPLNSDATFANLPAGTYTVKIDGLDKYYAVIATTSQSGISVSAGHSTPVSMKLSFGVTAGGGTTGSISLGVTIDDGTSPTPAPSPSATPVPTPTPTPTPTATPTPAPTATPAPSTSGYSDGFEGGLGGWTASFAPSSYSSATSASTAWNSSMTAAHTGFFGATPGGSDGTVLETGTYTLTLKNAVTLGSGSSLKFDLSSYTAQYYFKMCSFFVDASTDGGSTWSQVYQQTDSQLSWATRTVDLSAYQGKATKVRFRFVYDYYLGTDSMTAPTLDNISLGS